MASEKIVLRLGTRGSPLALAQADEVRARLVDAGALPFEAVDIVVVRTTGDVIQDRALSEAGGKGLFTKELDAALLDGSIDVAVHSAKDLTTLLPDAVAIAGYLPRENVRDALITREGGGLASLPHGAVVGSASLRRQAQLRRLRPDLNVQLLRGNVQTRLGKLDAGHVHATILAVAGLRRLGLTDRISEVLSIEDFLPAVGQGAIAVAMRTGDGATADLLTAVLDPATGVAVRCERAFLRVLDGSCRTPIAGHAVIDGSVIRIRGQILAPDGSDAVETLAEGPIEAPEALGQDAGHALLARTPAALLDAFRQAG